MIRCLLVPLLAAVCCALASNGNMAGVFVMILLSAAVTIACRMILINIGYAKGVRAAESFMKHAEELKHGSRLAGVFMLGAITVIAVSGLNFSAGLVSDSGVMALNNLMAYVLPGLAGLAAVCLAYHMLAKKNRSLAFTVIVFMIAGLALVLLGFAGDYVTPLALPWVMK